MDVISDVGAGVRETERLASEHGSGKSDGLSLSLSLSSPHLASLAGTEAWGEIHQMHGGGARP